MHIVIAALAVIGGVLAILWKLGILFRTGRDVIETAADLQAAARRHQFRNAAADRPPIAAIDEPMLAATTILALAHRAERELTIADRGRMADIVKDVFRIDAETAQGLVAQAAHAAGSVDDEVRWARHLARLLRSRCTPDERREVVTMIARTMEEGRLTDRQQPLVAAYREAAGLR